MKKLQRIDWSHPGENRYTGPIDKAIMTYDDIPLDVRKRLVARAAPEGTKRKYDEIVVIDRAGIRGKEYGYVNLRQMFFGSHIRAETVSMEGWPHHQIERGLVYTESDCTVLVPLVCGNVARVDRVPLEQMPPPVEDGTPFLPPPGPELQTPINSVPEPSTIVMLTTALIALLFTRRSALSKQGKS